MNFNHQAEKLHDAIGVSAERYHELATIAGEYAKICINSDADTIAKSYAYQIVMESNLTGVEQLLLFDLIRDYEDELANFTHRFAEFLLSDEF